MKDTERFNEEIEKIFESIKACASRYLTEISIPEERITFAFEIDGDHALFSVIIQWHFIEERLSLEDGKQKLRRRLVNAVKRDEVANRGAVFINSKSSTEDKFITGEHRAMVSMYIKDVPGY